ncbi:HNHc domain-containing protein [Vibrio owensii]|uniref:HNHc domain-containing protein n=1 Tax=Vibrio owensii TaxID=696485 RepID=A0AAU9Q0S9_9VIBR|nr:HNHc domain-containing protein [Vibrio owensii]
MRNKQHDYSEVQLAFLKENCTLPRKELTEKFNAKFGTELSLDAINGTCKRNNWLTGRTGNFQKGDKPWNAGTKGLSKPNSGCFKKGQKPNNVKPIGHERFCEKDRLYYIKVNERNPYTGAMGFYRPKHAVIWEQANGRKIPEGHIVRFKDGDYSNFDPDNLDCVSKALNLRLNQRRLNKAPDELKETIRAVSELEVAVFEKQKQIKEDK